MAANVSIGALTGTSQAVDVLFVIGRFVDFAFLAPGGRWVGGARHRPSIGLSWSKRRLYGILSAAAGGLAAIALVNILLQGATAGGLSLSGCALVEPVHVGHAETDYGEVMLINRRSL